MTAPAEVPPLVWLCDRCSSPCRALPVRHEWLCRPCALARIDADNHDDRHPIHRHLRSA